MKSLIKETIRSYLYEYHSYQVRKDYKKLLALNGIANKPVSGEQEWKVKWEVLGKTSTVFYRLFSHYIGYDINIIPEDICKDIVEPILNPRRYAKYYGDKNIFDRIFPKGYLPKTLLRKMNGAYYDAQYKRLDLNDILLYDILSEAETSKIIIKPSVGGISGIGVMCFVKKNNEWIQFTAHTGGEETHVCNRLNVDFLNRYQSKDFIIQEALDQHESISKFCSTSVNTLRLTLYRSVENDECVLPSAIMRIGREGSITDNAHTGGCFVGIDINTGKLGHKVFDQYGCQRTLYNNIDFNEDINLPFPLWQNVLEFAKSIGSYIPHCRLIALDLSVDKLGTPKMIEFNVEYFGVWLFQFSMSSMLGHYTDEIIEYCKTHKNELEYMLLI